MSEELLPITEADVVKGAEFVWPDDDEATVVVLAVDEDVVMYRWHRTGRVMAEGLARFVEDFRKRAPKPPRYVVELRPPKKGERYFNSVNPRLVSTADYDFSDYALRWVIVDGDV